jgi:APA family basic amino acid/polyamine antiporter
LPSRNPELAAAVRVLPSRNAQRALGTIGIAVLALFFIVHTWKDITAPMPWYLKSTPLWIVVMAVGSAIYTREVAALRRNGTDVRALFATLPPE